MSLTKKDYQDALLSQSACNMSGIVHAFSRVITEIRDEPEAKKQGTDWVNRHPICRLYAEQITFLSGAGMTSNGQGWGKAVEECKEMIKKFESADGTQKPWSF